MSQKISISGVNAMTKDAFMGCFGDIAEHSPWVAEAATAEHPFANVEAMIVAFEKSVRNASRERQLDLLRAHPDLAGKAKAITDDSRREQKGAGLDSLSPREFTRFSALNQSYREKFGFPFILAVRGATKHAILDAFERRIANDLQAEFGTALGEVCKILRFRLEDRVEP
jgi:2-oxo-4-hydroxy-4-carboxy-5-ureidoimidazoline decarboxylase